MQLIGVEVFVAPRLTIRSTCVLHRVFMCFNVIVSEEHTDSFFGVKCEVINS
jgi:hypothetical protein